MIPLSRGIKLDHPQVTQALFYPRREERGEAPENCYDLDIAVDEQITVGGRFHLAGKTEANILFFHGNGETVVDYDDIGSGFVAHGMSLLAVDYRGYGWSGGEPSASRMLRDCHTLFEFTRDWLERQERKGPLLVMGRSLGSACAIELAATEAHGIAGVVLDSAFGPTLPLLRCLGIDADELGISEEEGFNNLKKIGMFIKPLFILHAQLDEIIPISDASELHARCMSRMSEFQVVPGADHNTIFDRTGRLYFEEVARFIRKIGQPVRRRRTGRR